MTHAQLKGPRAQGLVAELCDLVRHQYPDAEFQTSQGEDPDGIYVNVYTDPPLECYELSELVSLRETEITIQEGLIIMMLPASKPQHY